MVLDELKLLSDDSTYTEDHILFLLSRYRAQVLKSAYADIKKEVPNNNYQTICLNLEEHEGIKGLPCEGLYLRSTEKIPEALNIGHAKVHPADYFAGEIAYITRDRF